MSESFWRRAEKIEEDYTGDGDLPRFQRRMSRMGFDDLTIADRVQAVQELKDACGKALNLKSSEWK